MGRWSCPGCCWAPQAGLVYPAGCCGCSAPSQPHLGHPAHPVCSQIAQSILLVLNTPTFPTFREKILPSQQNSQWEARLALYSKRRSPVKRGHSNLTVGETKLRGRSFTSLVPPVCQEGLEYDSVCILVTLLFGERLKKPPVIAFCLLCHHGCTTATRPPQHHTQQANTSFKEQKAHCYENSSVLLSISQATAEFLLLLLKCPHLHKIVCKQLKLIKIIYHLKVKHLISRYQTVKQAKN